MEEQEKPIIEIEEEEKQTYKFMNCRTCKVETRFVSTLSPKGDWVCCRCRTKVCEKQVKLEIDPQGYRIRSLKEGELK